jgi:hypothetical protein
LGISLYRCPTENDGLKTLQGNKDLPEYAFYHDNKAFGQWLANGWTRLRWHWWMSTWKTVNCQPPQNRDSVWLGPGVFRPELGVLQRQALLQLHHTPQ